MCLIYQYVTIRQNLHLNFETAFSATFGFGRQINNVKRVMSCLLFISTDAG